MSHSPTTPPRWWTTQATSWDSARSIALAAGHDEIVYATEIFRVTMTTDGTVTSAAVLDPDPVNASTKRRALAVGLGLAERVALSLTNVTLVGKLTGRPERRLPAHLALVALDCYATVADVANHHGGRVPDAGEAATLARRLLWDLTKPNSTLGEQHATGNLLATLAERIDAADHHTARLGGHPAVDDLLARLDEHAEAQKQARDELSGRNPLTDDDPGMRT